MPAPDQPDKPPPPKGVYWIREDDYATLRKLFIDGSALPASYKDWLRMAEEMERGLKAYGHPVMRVPIDPLAFAEWCAAQGTTPGREGRKTFVAAAVRERYGEPE